MENTFTPFTEMTIAELTAMTPEQLEANAIVCRVSVDDIHNRMSELAEISTEEVVATIPVEMITPEMAEAGVTTETPFVTREEVVAELGEEAVEKMEAEALQPTTDTLVA